MAVTFELICILALLGLGVTGIAFARMRSGSRIVYVSAFVVSAAAFAVAVASLTAPSSIITLPLGLPWLGAHFRMDALAAFFLAVVNFGAACSSFYAIGYGQHEAEPGRVLPFFPLFLAAMNLVVLAADAFTFLFAWELMSLTSWALVMVHHRESETVRAGVIYLVMASFGTLCLLLAFGLLAGPDGAYAFSVMRAHHLSAVLGAAVLVLVLLGTGSKAGLVPLHVWLPLAHPAAPSHVSALMSGVMTKVAVYAFVRIVFDLLGPVDWHLSMIVIAIGGVTALLGVLDALMQHDLKRLLAYHTVENIGIIFIGLGLALAFRADGLAAAAALAVTAALFHVVNHSLFKSLLFFGAGAVQTATGERDIDHLGGLIHAMPMTAFAFLAGAAAISALPPFNGFVSEWMTFQAIFLSPSFPQWGLRLLSPATGAVLALAAALAAACFVKAFGVTFLGRPRSEAAASSHEVDGFSWATMLVLAAVCLLLGILPGLAIDWLSPVAHGLVGTQMPTQASVPWLSIVPVSDSRSSYNGLLVFAFIAFSASLSVLAIHSLASRAMRRAPAWDCGTPVTSARTQYTAGSFSQPIRRVFGSVVFRARENVTMPPPGDMSAARLQVTMHDIPWESIYAPLIRAVSASADWLNRLQFLTIRRYLTSCLSDIDPSSAGSGDMDVTQAYLVQGIEMVLVLSLAPLLTGVVRKLKARLLRRRGPPVIQPYRDLFRLLHKDTVVAENASWLFRAAPYLIFAATWVATALVPTFATGLMFNWTADLIAIVALLGSARFMLALAALDIGTSFGGLGASREMMIASLAEPAMIMIVFTLALIAGSTQLSTIADFMLTNGPSLRVSLGMAAVALILIAVAENGRIPVDNPATHLELTMVHEAMVLEYSGRHLAMIELASSLKLLLYISLIACVFTPWGLAAMGSPPVAYAAGAGAYVLKLGAGATLLAVSETAIAKMRVFRVPNLLGAALMLGLLGTLLLFVSGAL